MRASLLTVGLVLLLALQVPFSVAERVSGMSKSVYDKISSIQSQFEDERWEEALFKLEDLEGARLSNYERAHLLNMKGFALYQLERVDDAMTAYREALAQDNLPSSQLRGLLTTISQLALMNEDYGAAERYAVELVELKADIPTAAASWVILAQARMGQENYAGALDPLLTAIAMERDRGKPPRENWLVMLSSVYYMADDYVAMREVLYELVNLHPREKYVLNLAAIHGELGDTGKQLALVESLRDDQRLEKGQHLLLLTNLLLAHNLPYKAGVLLEREIERGGIDASQRNLELLSQAWYMAGERRKAIAPLERAAAIDEVGELYLRAARLYMDEYDWAGARAQARKAAAVSSGDELGEALLMVGMALANAKEYAQAEEVLRQAAQHENVSRWCEQWLAYIQSEQQRMAALSNSAQAY